MVFLSTLTWLDSHSAAVTALATVVLVVITVAYVIVTYLLVKEQRLQGECPDIARSWADPKALDDSDIKLQNVGTGTAVEVMVVRGPRTCADVHLPDLGEQLTLRPGEELVWRVRPLGETSSFPAGELSFTVHYLDSRRERAFFDAGLIRFEGRDEGVAIRDLGYGKRVWTKRRMRRMARRGLSLSDRARFHWRTRNLDLTELLVDPEVRGQIRVNLGQLLDGLLVWSAQEATLRHDL